MKIRKPYVAGRFYPSGAAEIKKQLAGLVEEERKNIRYDLCNTGFTGGVVPHAGYMFSARQAIHFFEILRVCGKRFDTFFILNPNHTGIGKEIEMDGNDLWETPLGQVETDRDFYPLEGTTESTEAQRHEHSGEVMLPMLQYFLDYPFRIVPITLSRQNPENAVAVARAVYEANLKLKKKICIIASSDFSHFLSPEEGRMKDQLVVDEILKFNSRGVYEIIRQNNISVCGFGPIMALMEYTLLHPGTAVAEILKRGHSGEVIPSSDVVDYISMLFYNQKQTK
ncbi:MAG: AmmeMemoRadiSam system protein B [Bacteroidales bacterium]|nr:AmmeMemoRadiSam system protein B [Bacteroidales bacterium]